MRNDISKAMSPEAVVQRQYETYNAHDLEGWLATYASDARQFEHPGTLLADGIDQIQARAVIRFAEPNLKANLLSRTVFGELVIDHEIVERTFPEGTGTIGLIAIYQVSGGKIRTASFVTGEKTLEYQ